MDVGLFFPFRNPPRWRLPFPAFYAEQLRQIEQAEDLGYDHVWLTEHHFSEDGYSPALFPLAAAIAVRTSTIRIGTFLVLLPLHHPLEVAENAATVDVLSDGRFDLGVGLGYVPHEFAGYGISRRERAQRLEEGLAILRGAWTQDDFAYSGQHFQLSQVNLSPRPVQQPHPPIWVGGLRRRATERAARLGCHFLGLSDAAGQQTYDAALVASGRDPSDYQSAQLRWVYVAPDADRAWEDTAEHLHYMLHLYGQWLAEAMDFDGGKYSGVPPLPSASQLRHADQALIGAPIIGTPDDVAAELERHRRAIRTTHLVLGMHLPGLDPAKAKASMELFAKEVLPILH
ncbi:MAG TPA: LLM class flavin-dependent oxidoreductase [Pseudonocardia sp.]|jgi:probable F420-dependent oxidoreductase